MAVPAPKLDLHSRASRERLAKMVVALLDHWALPLNDQAALLGISAQSRSTIARYRRGEPFADSADLLARPRPRVPLGERAEPPLRQPRAARAHEARL